MLHIVAVINLRIALILANIFHDMANSASAGNCYRVLSVELSVVPIHLCQTQYLGTYDGWGFGRFDNPNFERLRNVFRRLSPVIIY